jgi:predicted NUDIX family NTP pyrophosphohydrolase
MKAAGLVMYRYENGEPKFFIVHPGGPLWTHRDVGAWSIPKGEVDEKDTDVLMTAVREFVEETGFVVHEPFIPLGTITQKSGKVVHAWAFEDKAGINPANMKCNEIEIDHPRGSGNKITIPECDRGDFFTFEECQTKLIPAQVPLIAALKTALDNPTG